jgi:DNA-binding NtrC family response regulator
MNRAEIKILIVDDEFQQAKILQKVLMKKGYSVDAESSSSEAKEMIMKGGYDIIISDLQMPNYSGMDLLRAKPDSTLFIMITGYGSIASAVESMKNGAFDYINKPFNMDEFILKVDKAVENLRLKKQARQLEEIVNPELTFFGMVGRSRVMLELYELIKNVSKVNINVLITGCSGTGKELVAKAIHENSERKGKPFIAINCSAIPENLLESELFGHTKGAFTGATENMRGVFEQANGGTLFLDEIGEMPYNLQPKLLRVLENWEIKPLGSEKIRKVDVRLVSATNEPIEKLISEKKFREDLFYRISTMRINVPPLNDRREDIPIIVYNYLKKLEIKFNKELSISHSALDILCKYDYKGNIRELENILEQASIISSDGTIKDKDLKISDGLKTELTITSEAGIKGDKPLSEIEKMYILKVMEKTRGNKQRAAEILKIDRKTLYKKLKEYQIGD